MPKAPRNLCDFESLVEVVKILRSPDGCPWDQQQTHQSLTPFAIEETYELVEAIEHNDDHELCEELGDVLLQVVLHARIAEQRGAFALKDVIEQLNQKMVRRHPHVFGDQQVDSAAKAKANWEAIKRTEKQKAPVDAFFAQPKTLPALMSAQKIGEKSGHFHFDWSDAKAVFAKVREEFFELQEALEQDSPTHQAHEIGDLLFSIVQLARHLHFDAESVLRQANQRFERRFRQMLKLIEQDRNSLQKLSANEFETYWQQAKKLT